MAAGRGRRGNPRLNPAVITDISVITEIEDAMKALDPVQQKFVLHWGEMGTRWGVNRTVAQIHALLYLSARPLNADELVETLQVARSNVSTSLRELQGWGIVRMVHVLGDKRDHFETMKDVWEMFRVVLDERKRREVDPTLAVLRECLTEGGRKQGGTDSHTLERLKHLADFFETTTAWYSQVRSWPASALAQLVRMGDKVREWVGGRR